MPGDDGGLGRVAPGYRAWRWFGRPLLLSDRLRGQDRRRLGELIDAELARGCDGFAFRLNAGPAHAAFAEQMASFARALEAYSQVAFVYIEIAAEGVERHVLEVFRRHAFPRGYMLSARDPNVLRNLYRLAPDPDASFAIAVDTEQGFPNVGRCPHTTVEIPDALASHDRILDIRRSMKEVFVRAVFKGAGQHVTEEALKKIEKRVNWLAHEKVDAIISNRTDLLLPFLAGAGTPPAGGRRPAAER